MTFQLLSRKLFSDPKAVKTSVPPSSTSKMRKENPSCCVGHESCKSFQDECIVLAVMSKSFLPRIFEHSERHLFENDGTLKCLPSAVLK
uniref:Ovule protein n=1 Tax=Ascaris lumbricoides TaxID=6252 RepID=A0A0M3I1W0_ASCLU